MGAKQLSDMWVQTCGLTLYVTLFAANEVVVKKIMIAYTLGYFALYFTVKKVVPMFATERLDVIIKRTQTGINTILVSIAGVYALAYGQDIKFEDVTSSMRSTPALVALTMEATLYCIDLLLVSEEQKKIKMYLVHHFALIIFWIVGITFNLGFPLLLIGQSQEIVNPMWYIHWTLLVGDIFLRPHLRTMFVINYWMLQFLYILVRVILCTPISYYILYQGFFVWPLVFSCWMTCGVTLMSFISAYNGYKLWRSYLHIAPKLRSKRSE